MGKQTDYMRDLKEKCLTCAFLFTGNWIRERFETPGAFQMSEEEKRILLDRLVRSTR